VGSAHVTNYDKSSRPEEPGLDTAVCICRCQLGCNVDKCTYRTQGVSIRDSSAMKFRQKLFSSSLKGCKLHVQMLPHVDVQDPFVLSISTSALNYTSIAANCKWPVCQGVHVRNFLLLTCTVNNVHSINLTPTSEAMPALKQLRYKGHSNTCLYR